MCSLLQTFVNKKLNRRRVVIVIEKAKDFLQILSFGLAYFFRSVGVCIISLATVYYHKPQWAMTTPINKIILVFSWLFFGNKILLLNLMVIMDYSYRNGSSFAKDNSSFLGIAHKMALGQIIFLVIDIGSNLVVDSTSSDPMIGFIIFIIQVLAILINLISFLMISSHEGIQSKFARSKTQIHNLNAVAMISYLVLTIGWYVWSLRRSWPAAGDQFSYSFLPKRRSTANATESLPFGSGFDNLKDDREFFTLWSPGYIALYTIQRTMALLYYGIDLLSISVLVNDVPGKVALDSQRAEELKIRSLSAFIHAKDSVEAERSTDGMSQHHALMSSSNEYIPFPESAEKSVRGRRARRSWEGQETLGI